MPKYKRGSALRQSRVLLPDAASTLQECGVALRSPPDTSSSPLSPATESSSTEQEDLQPLYVSGVCRWNGCGALCNSQKMFLRHVQVEHQFDETAVAQISRQMALVKRLRQMALEESKNLIDMMAHIVPTPTNHLQQPPPATVQTGTGSVHPSIGPTQSAATSIVTNAHAAIVQPTSPSRSSNAKKMPSHHVLLRTSILQSVFKRMTWMEIRLWIADHFRSSRLWSLARWAGIRQTLDHDAEFVRIDGGKKPFVYTYSPANASTSTDNATHSSSVAAPSATKTMAVRRRGRPRKNPVILDSIQGSGVGSGLTTSTHSHQRPTPAARLEGERKPPLGGVVDPDVAFLLACDEGEEEEEEPGQQRRRATEMMLSAIWDRRHGKEQRLLPVPGEEVDRLLVGMSLPVTPPTLPPPTIPSQQLPDRTRVVSSQCGAAVSPCRTMPVCRVKLERVPMIEAHVVKCMNRRALQVQAATSRVREDTGAAQVSSSQNGEPRVILERTKVATLVPASCSSLSVDTDVIQNDSSGGLKSVGSSSPFGLNNSDEPGAATALLVCKRERDDEETPNEPLVTEIELVPASSVNWDRQFYASSDEHPPPSDRDLVRQCFIESGKDKLAFADIRLWLCANFGYFRGFSSAKWIIFRGKFHCFGFVLAKKGRLSLWSLNRGGTEGSMDAGAAESDCIQPHGVDAESPTSCETPETPQTTGELDSHPVVSDWTLSRVKAETPNQMSVGIEGPSNVNLVVSNWSMSRVKAEAPDQIENLDEDMPLEIQPEEDAPVDGAFDESVPVEILYENEFPNEAVADEGVQGTDSNAKENADASVGNLSENNVEPSCCFPSIIKLEIPLDRSVDIDYFNPAPVIHSAALPEPVAVNESDKIDEISSDCESEYSVAADDRVSSEEDELDEQEDQSTTPTLDSLNPTSTFGGTGDTDIISLTDTIQSPVQDDALHSATFDVENSFGSNGSVVANPLPLPTPTTTGRTLRKRLEGGQREPEVQTDETKDDDSDVFNDDDDDPEDSDFCPETDDDSMNGEHRPGNLFYKNKRREEAVNSHQTPPIFDLIRRCMVTLGERQLQFRAIRDWLSSNYDYYQDLLPIQWELLITELRKNPGPFVTLADAPDTLWTLDESSFETAVRNHQEADHDLTDENHKNYSQVADVSARGLMRRCIVESGQSHLEFSQIRNLMCEKFISFDKLTTVEWERLRLDLYKFPEFVSERRDGRTLWSLQGSASGGTVAKKTKKRDANKVSRKSKRRTNVRELLQGKRAGGDTNKNHSPVEATTASSVVSDRSLSQSSYEPPPNPIPHLLHLCFVQSNRKGLVFSDFRGWFRSNFLYYRNYKDDWQWQVVWSHLYSHSCFVRDRNATGRWRVDTEAAATCPMADTVTGVGSSSSNIAEEATAPPTLPADKRTDDDSDNSESSDQRTNQSSATKKSCKRGEHPQASVLYLVRKFFLSDSGGKWRTFDDLRRWLSDNFTYYRRLRTKDWSSVRDVLFECPCFVSNTNGKRALWRLSIVGPCQRCSDVTADDDDVWWPRNKKKQPVDELDVTSKFRKNCQTYPDPPKVKAKLLLRQCFLESSKTSLCFPEISAWLTDNFMYYRENPKKIETVRTPLLSYPYFSRTLLDRGIAYYSFDEDFYRWNPNCRSVNLSRKRLQDVNREDGQIERFCRRNFKWQDGRLFPTAEKQLDNSSASKSNTSVVTKAITGSDPTVIAESDPTVIADSDPTVITESDRTVIVGSDSTVIADSDQTTITDSDPLIERVPQLSNEPRCMSDDINDRSSTIGSPSTCQGDCPPPIESTQLAECPSESVGNPVSETPVNPMSEPCNSSDGLTGVVTSQDSHGAMDATSADVIHNRSTEGVDRAVDNTRPLCDDRTRDDSGDDSDAASSSSLSDDISKFISVPVSAARKCGLHGSVPQPSWLAELGGERVRNYYITHAKQPCFPMWVLLVRCIRLSDGQRTDCPAMYRWLAKNFAYYRHFKNSGWGVVRYELNRHPFFVRLGAGRTAVWTLDEELVNNMKLLPRHFNNMQLVMKEVDALADEDGSDKAVACSDRVPARSGKSCPRSIVSDDKQPNDSAGSSGGNCQSDVVQDQAGRSEITVPVVGPSSGEKSVRKTGHMSEVDDAVPGWLLRGVEDMELQLREERRTSAVDGATCHQSLTVASDSAGRPLTVEGTEISIPLSTDVTGEVVPQEPRPPEEPVLSAAPAVDPRDRFPELRSRMYENSPERPPFLLHAFLRQSLVESEGGLTTAQMLSWIGKRYMFFRDLSPYMSKVLRCNIRAVYGFIKHESETNPGHVWWTMDDTVYFRPKKRSAVARINKLNLHNKTATTPAVDQSLHPVKHVEVSTDGRQSTNSTNCLKNDHELPSNLIVAHRRKKRVRRNKMRVNRKVNDHFPTRRFCGSTKRGSNRSVGGCGEEKVKELRRASLGKRNTGLKEDRPAGKRQGGRRRRVLRAKGNDTTGAERTRFARKDRCYTVRGESCKPGRVVTSCWWRCGHRLGGWNKSALKRNLDRKKKGRVSRKNETAVSVVATSNDSASVVRPEIPDKRSRKRSKRKRRHGHDGAAEHSSAGQVLESSRIVAEGTKVVHLDDGRLPVKRKRKKQSKRKSSESVTQSGRNRRVQQVDSDDTSYSDKRRCLDVVERLEAVAEQGAGGEPSNAGPAKRSLRSTRTTVRNVSYQEATDSEGDCSGPKKIDADSLIATDSEDSGSEWSGIESGKKCLESSSDDSSLDEIVEEEEEDMVVAKKRKGSKKCLESSSDDSSLDEIVDKDEEEEIVEEEQEDKEEDTVVAKKKKGSRARSSKEYVVDSVTAERVKCRRSNKDPKKKNLKKKQPVEASITKMQLEFENEMKKNGKFYQENDVLPAFSYIVLITHAINHSPKKQLTLVQINQWMCDNFLYCRKRANTFKDSIKTSLSQNPMCVKVSDVKGGPWKLDPEQYAKKHVNTVFCRYNSVMHPRIRRRLQQLSDARRPLPVQADHSDPVLQFLQRTKPDDSSPPFRIFDLVRACLVEHRDQQLGDQAIAAWIRQRFPYYERRPENELRFLVMEHLQRNLCFVSSGDNSVACPLLWTFDTQAKIMSHNELRRHDKKRSKACERKKAREKAAAGQKTVQESVKDDTAVQPVLLAQVPPLNFQSAQLPPLNSETTQLPPLDH